MGDDTYARTCCIRMGSGRPAGTDAANGAGRAPEGALFLVGSHRGAHAAWIGRRSTRRKRAACDVARRDASREAVFFGPGRNRWWWLGEGVARPWGRGGAILCRSSSAPECRGGYLQSRSRLGTSRGHWRGAFGGGGDVGDAMRVGNAWNRTKGSRLGNARCGEDTG